MPFIHTLPQQIWTAYMLATTGLAFWRGGWAERIVTLGMIADSLASAVFLDMHQWSAPPWGVLIVDSTYLILVVGVALRSDRWWPLWAAAFQLLEVAISFAKLTDHHVGARAHFAAGEIWSYLILVSVMVGIGFEARPGRPRPVSRST